MLRQIVIFLDFSPSLYVAVDPTAAAVVGTKSKIPSRSQRRVYNQRWKKKLEKRCIATYHLLDILYVLMSKFVTLGKFNMQSYFLLLSK